MEKHGGVFGGCWCISFHLEPGENKRWAGRYRELKRARLREGRAHAALVFDGTEAIGWCQFGPTAELPNIRSAKEYERGLARLPDWRITCFFIDRERRGEGVASLALREAVRYVAESGGGRVEAYPEDYTDERTSSSFLCSGTLRMFERAGFRKDRKIAMRRWVVVQDVPPAPGRTSLRPSRRPPDRSPTADRAPRGGTTGHGRTPPRRPPTRRPAQKHRKA